MVAIQHFTCKGCGADFINESFGRPRVYCFACRPGTYTPKHTINMRHRYKLDIAGFAAIAARQGNACAVCRIAFKDSRDMHVDHDHSCCAVPPTCGCCIRGIVCAACNSKLSVDREKWIAAAAEYLSRGVVLSSVVRSATVCNGRKLL